jgi:hypothetical protein
MYLRTARICLQKFSSQTLRRYLSIDSYIPGQSKGSLYGILTAFLFQIHPANNNQGDQEPPLVLEELAQGAHRSWAGNVLQG